MGKPRARELKIPFSGTPGPLNAITDVAGIEVGFKTIVRGSGKLSVGQGPVRTGVTAIFPRGKTVNTPVFAGISILNGAGEMTGAAWVTESGLLEGPILLTNTHSVGVAQSSVLKWWVEHGMMLNNWYLPVVSETYDGTLSDINGFHVKEADVFEALDTARGGPVPEGNVGGGTGAVCFQFKGGTGTASREICIDGCRHTLGALVQANFGARGQLRIAGLPVGQYLEGKIPLPHDIAPGDAGSLVIVITTDAPLPPHQLKRVATRAGLGMARTGGVAGNGSGDIFIAFSTSPFQTPNIEREVFQTSVFPNSLLTPIFEAVVECVEEAIINAMIAAETMTGINDHCVPALPHADVMQLMEKTFVRFQQAR